MSIELPVVYLARHGETTWSLTGQHTSLTDLPLTERGEQYARALGERLIGPNFRGVFTSPLQRALRTCRLAGFGGAAQVDRGLVEWNYGKYEEAQRGRVSTASRAKQQLRDPKRRVIDARLDAGLKTRVILRACF
jgi:broad specificity phosphatase PhoE